MAELREMACPQCEQANHPKSAADGILAYRCRACGLVYYGPCGCDTRERDARIPAPVSATSPPPLPEGWRMTERVTVIGNGVAAAHHAGGC